MIRFVNPAALVQRHGFRILLIPLTYNVLAGKSGPAG